MSTTAATSSHNIVDFLDQWKWFRELPNELRSLTLETSIEKSVSACEYVARAGSSSSHWYGVISGQLQMYVVSADGVETTLYNLGKGEWCGDGSLLKRELLRYDLRAITEARICLIPASTFEVLRQTSLDFSNFLCDVMNDRMGEFVGMLVASRLLSPDHRVAKALLMLAKNAGQQSHKLSVHQQELALICGLSRQRVNMALSAFKQSGIVRVEGSRGYLVVHTERLRDYLEEV